MSHPSLTDEFPDFDVATLPEIPENFIPAHWHNETCPHWVDATDERFELWIDYANPEEREFVIGSRFLYLFRERQIGGPTETLAYSDDWATVLAAIQNNPASPTHHCGICNVEFPADTLMRRGSGWVCSDCDDEPAHSLAELLAMAQEARPLNDDEWGSERQIVAETAFFDAFHAVMGDTPNFDIWCLKATSDEMIDRAISLLTDRLAQ